MHKVSSSGLFTELSSPVNLLRATIIRFLSFDAHNVTPQVYVAMAVIYLALLVVTLLSIRKHGFSAKGRATWMLVVVLVPIFGIAAYCVSCLMKADITFMQNIGLFRKSPARRGT